MYAVLIQVLAAIIIVSGLVICAFIISCFIAFNYKIKRSYNFDDWPTNRVFYFYNEFGRYHATLFHCDHWLGRIAFCYEKQGDKLILIGIHKKFGCRRVAVSEE